MKRTVLSLLVAVIALVFSTNSYAAVDMFLQIKGEKTGKVYKIRCTSPDGKKLQATFDNVAPDVYTATILNSNGVAMRSYDKSSPQLFTMTCVTSPRDAASGLATGKRMHKPITITKEISASSPSFSRGFTGIDCSSMDEACTVSLSVMCSSGSGAQAIEIQSWSWGASNSGTSMGSGSTR